MSLSKLLSAWRADPQVFGNVSAWRSIPARTAQYEPIPDDADATLAAALANIGYAQLYAHQALAWRQVHLGKNIVVATGTASGKTLCYNLPILNRLIQAEQGRALYLFPTKALAQDQANAIRQLSEAIRAAAKRPAAGLAPAIYDGDTPQQARPAIRKQARILLTNPDMLHTGILPHHTAWEEFFRNLEFVVIDELHIYRGIFGSHFANVLRRLRRIAHHYGASPQFIMTSATIANPVALAEKLTEADVFLIDQDGSRRGAQTFWLYNPPIVNPDLGLRRSTFQECLQLADDLLANAVQTAIFTRSRRSVEILLTYLREQMGGTSKFDKHSSTVNQQIRGYRSGYLPGERRAIEEGLRTGSVRCVVATNALELGVDIGGMGAVLMVGYPGTIAATWQQAGRAGRAEQASLAILLLSADPLDQFLAAHPEYFLERSPEQVLINPDNILILLAHLRSAAFELPFSTSESFGNLEADRLKEFLNLLHSAGELYRTEGAYFWMADQYPAASVSLRTASPDKIVLQVDNDGRARTIGEIDRASAAWMVHPNAVYLHEGQPYFVDNLDLERKIANLSPFKADYYTEPRLETEVQLEEQLTSTPVAAGLTGFGEIGVTTQVVGYRQMNWTTRELLGNGLVDLPPAHLQTTGYWLSLSEAAVDSLRESGLWRNDPNDYGPNWKKQRALARQRDGYHCQVCGVGENEREHDVHHKAPFKTFVSPEIANQLGNLITLCHNCHRRVETVVRVRSGLAGLAYTLSHLAPLYLMCDSRDLGVYSDPQSKFAGGQPVIVIYDQVPAGIGLSQRIYEIHIELMQAAQELIRACPCSEGCPSCVGPGGELGTGGKRETLAILEILNPAA